MWREARRIVQAADAAGGTTFRINVSAPLVLEVAVQAGCDFIISYNQRDFAGSGRFGIEVLTPKQFLTMIGAIQ